MPEPISLVQAVERMMPILAELSAAYESFDSATQQRLDALYATLRSKIAAASFASQQIEALEHFLVALNAIPALRAVVEGSALAQSPASVFPLGSPVALWVERLPVRLGPSSAPRSFVPPRPAPSAPPQPAPFVPPDPGWEASLPPYDSIAISGSVEPEPVAADEPAMSGAEPEPISASSIEHPPLQRYTEIDYPSQVVLGSRTSLSISLLREPSAPQLMPLLIADTGIADRLPQIEVVVRARGFDFEQSNTQMLDVARDDDVDLRFVLIPRQLGPQTIRIDFYQEGRRIGTLRQATTIVEQASIALPVVMTSRTAKVEPLQFATVGAVAPDLELCIETDPHDPLQLYFSLHSTIETIDYHHSRMGTVRLSGSPLERMQAVYKELSGLAGALPATPDQIEYQRRRLARIGNQLWEELFSSELKAAYWQFKDQVKTLLVTSDEPWIPWEMVRPFQFDQQGVRTDAPFLCEQFIIARWLSGNGPAERMAVQRVCPVAPVSLDLASVQAELAYLQGLDQLCAGLVPEPPYSDRNRVIDLFESGTFNVLHFAAHGSFDAQMPDNSAINLTGGALRPSDLLARFGGARARPLIFINACHGARAEFAFTGLGGWADQLVRQARVGAFIGAAWEVNDRLALMFAETFYSALLRDRKPVGESFSLARQQIRDAEPSNSTWLAYVLYADPSASVMIL